MMEVKNIQKRCLNKNIAENEDFANNIEQDLCKVKEILIFSYILKILKLLIIIACIGFFWAMIFQVIIQIEDDIWGADEIAKDNCSTDPAQGYFTYCYGLQDKTVYEVVVILFYFSFTTLSTVGLGDYHAKSNTERVVMSVGMLFGVAIFQILMSKFIEVLQEFQEFNKELDQGDQLSRFFGVLEKFNNNEPIKLELKKQIESFFDYKWSCDKNYAFDDERFNNIVIQVPEDLIDDIYM